MIGGQAVKILQALWGDYSVKIKAISDKLEQHTKRLYELGLQSGESFNELMQEIGECKDEQFAVVKEIFSIYEDVKQALDDIEHGKEIRPDTGLTRSIAGDEYRAKVRKYVEIVRDDILF